MTEEEAKQRWCPMSRTLHGNPDDGSVVAGNRHFEVGVLSGDCCLASGCMMWRWTGKTSGYCGLAGAPGREP